MPCDPVGGLHGPKGLRGVCGLAGVQGPIGPVAPVFMNLHILSVINDEDAESHLVHSNDWINSQGIEEGTKCGRSCLTLGSDTHLWYE